MHRPDDMFSYSKETITCTRIVIERQYAGCGFSEQIRSKLHLCMRTMKHEYLGECLRGMIRSLNFDPTGAYLVATRDNSFFLYDPRFNRVVRSGASAHEDSVNCVKFLSPRSFATGSDDGRVALWDARNVTAPVKLLRRHGAYSTKNIEYDEQSNRLFTIESGELVLSWDLGNITEAVSEKFDVIMRTPQTYQLRLAPDGSKLLVTTQHSCLIIINNFNGLTIVEDMCNSVGVLDKIARSFNINNTNAIEMLQRDEHQFLSQKRNTVSFHFAPPDFGSTLSVCFHPSNELIAYRSLQKRPYYNYVCENICLYDVRNTLNLAQCNTELDQYYSDFPRGRMLAVKEDVHVACDYELIKDISFSPDGRLIATPLANTVKLLAATPKCLNFDHFLNPMQKTSLPPSVLYDIRCPLIKLHSPVICCAFAPRDTLLATGSVDGEIHIHQPVL